MYRHIRPLVCEATAAVTTTHFRQPQSGHMVAPPQPFRTFAQRAKRQRSRGNSNRKGRRGNRRVRGGRGGKNAPAPPLSKILRMFVARVHPDKFVAFPDEQQVNENSLSELTGYLSNVANPDEEWMPAQTISMPFFLQGTGDDESLRRIDFRLRITQGDCKRLVQKQLEELFKTAGVPDPAFTWDDKFWRPQEALKEWDDEDEDAEQERPPRMTVDDALKTMDPMLQAIAAVPWLRDTDRVAVYVREKAFQDLESHGWRHVKPAAEVF